MTCVALEVYFSESVISGPVFGGSRFNVMSTGVGNLEMGIVEVDAKRRLMWTSRRNTWQWLRLWYHATIQCNVVTLASFS